MLLDAEPDMEVVGEAGDGLEALAKTVELSPDIVLLDVTLPGTGGLHALRRIHEVSPQTRVLMLTMHDDEGCLRETVAAGGLGYVLTRAADIELLLAIRAVHGGGTYLHAGHTEPLFESGGSQLSTQETGDSGPRLSPREHKVLRLIALGYANRQAASMLQLSVKTVEAHRSRVVAKLGLHNRAGLVRCAIQRRLLEAA